MDADPRPAASPIRSAAPLTAALVFALAAVTAATYLWNDLAELKSERRAREQAEHEVANAERVNMRAELERLSNMQAALAARSAALEQTTTELRDQNNRNRDALLLADTRQLLRFANEALHIGRDPERALTALTLADARLAEAGGARHAKLRAAIALERAALAKLPRADVAGIALALIRIEDQVQHMPLRVRIKGPEAAEQAARSASAGSAYDHVLARLKIAFRGFISVRRSDGPIEALLPPTEEYYLRRNLELKLEIARRAALDHDAAAFRLSARVARDWLALHFDPAAPMVRESVRDLDAMFKVELAPTFPDISGSLTLLERDGTGP